MTGLHTVPEHVRVSTLVRTLGIDRRTVYGLIRRGAFRAFRVGRRGDFRVEVESVRAWLAAQVAAARGGA